MLQIEAAKTFGADQWKKLDGNTVQLGHPDAYIALMNAGHEIKIISLRLPSLRVS